ncbi:heme-binding protein [Uliginosibacterium sp. sgz301328]|uniref:GlcG/HbpS family heme-binding protein n=1 Tax=Uliginosibacterium sp. sgz301328 TaxID=3243764 RepID=UPI00359CD922
MRHIAIATLAAVGIVSTLPAQAQVRTEKNISLALASEIAAASVEACTAKGYAVTATVVDRAGTVRAVLRADNAGVHTVDASRAKAYTSASTRTPTGTILENVQKTPAAQYLPNIEGFLVVAGGVPIKSGNDVIGAVGVGGAPGGHLDEQCAAAALDKVKDKLI